MKSKSLSPKYIFIYLIFFQLNIAYCQNEIGLPNGYYKTFEDFIQKSPSKYITEPLSIKNRLGSASFTLRDKSKSKINEYFAVVQNDSILVKAKDVEKN